MNAYQPYRQRNPYALALIVILVALVISFSAFRNLFGLRSLLQTAIFPFQAVTLSVWEGITGAPGKIANLSGLVVKNAELKREIDELKTGMMVLESAASENARLRSALGFTQANRFGFKLLPAQVIGKSPAPWYSVLIVNKGKKAGVSTGRTVLVKEGLVGRVIEVAPCTCKVMLLTDPGSAVAAVNARSRDFGVVQGGSENRLIMKYVGAGGDVKVGDEIRVSPISTVFPSGLPIGRVAKANKAARDLFYQIDIQPAVDFSKLEEIFILR